MALDWQLIWTLFPYFGINLALSITNKMLLEDFPFPWMLTTLHAAATGIGCRAITRPKLIDFRKEHLPVVLLFSCLFTINIAVSNASLHLVSLSFHQALRSTSPICVVLIQKYWFQKKYERNIDICLAAMSAGIVLTTFGDYYATALGVSLTLLGIVLASVKTIVTNELLTGQLKLTPLEILELTSLPAMLLGLLGALLAGEVHFAYRTRHSGPPTNFLLLNLALAFAQNYVSFRTNKIAGPLTLTVCANLKQLATIMLAIATFKIRVGLLGAFGMTLALGGSGYYSWVRLQKRNVMWQVYEVRSPGLPTTREKPELDMPSEKNEKEENGLTV